VPDTISGVVSHSLTYIKNRSSNYYRIGDILSPFLSAADAADTYESDTYFSNDAKSTDRQSR
jgi:hypothetical protein